jgi:[acyl-carrier-protein] S-malonyltransferase
MAPAAELMAGELAQVELGAPGATIWSTVSGEPVGDGAEIRGLLLRQFVAPVLWQPTIEAMFAAGVDAGLALGPGKALKGMVRRVARGLKVRVLAEASGLADTH